VPPEPRVTLDGLVTGLEAGAATNRPVAGATVELFRVDPLTGARQGEALHRRDTGADGAWGPVTVERGTFLEIVLAAPGHPVAHYFRTPFPRSTDVLHLRPPAALAAADRESAALVRLTRPRGYFSWPRDVVLLDGREVTERRDGHRQRGHRQRAPSRRARRQRGAGDVQRGARHRPRRAALGEPDQHRRMTW
jgi:hypothetical protein